MMGRAIRFLTIMLCYAAAAVLGLRLHDRAWAQVSITAPSPTPSAHVMSIAGTLGISSIQVGDDPTATPAVTPDPQPCGPIDVQVNDVARCAAIGKPSAPCYVRCGRLCWRKGRALWEWLGCKPLSALLAPTPSPRPTPTPTACPAGWLPGTDGCCPPGWRVVAGGCVSPGPSQTATPTVRPSPGPTQNNCDKGVAGWCVYWKTGLCTHPCPDS